jgi:hypothetical protein
MGIRKPPAFHVAPWVYLTLALAACSGQVAPTPSPVPGSVPLPTYRPIATDPALTYVCPNGRFIPSVIGTLRGDPADPRGVWLESPTGHRIDVVWPPGFAVRFQPAAAVYDGKRTNVARAGNRMEINTDPAGHAGSAEDPYPADQFNTGDPTLETCYAPPAK